MSQEPKQLGLGSWRDTPARCVWGDGPDALTAVYRYRYELDFVDNPKRRCVWLMLNPSTANEAKPDPTVTRCINFARAWDFDGIGVVNLFALRSTDPRGLYGHVDPVGPDNDAAIVDAVVNAGLTVAGWGTHGGFLNRDIDVYELLCWHKLTLHCLATNANGSPGHPLYLSASLTPRPWAPTRKRLKTAYPGD